jgi:translocation and assembly module TamB
MRLRCQPQYLLFGQLAVQELALKGVRIQDNSVSDSNGPEFIWPQVSGFPTRLNAWIDRLTVEDLTYQKPDQRPVALANISAGVQWRNSRLSMTNLSLLTTSGRVSGSLTAGFGEALLTSALVFEPLHSFAGCNRIEVQTRLKPGQAPEQVAGELTATVLADTRTRYNLTGTIGLSPKALKVKELTLTEKGRRGAIHLSGAVPLGGAVQLSMKADELELSPGADNKIALSGTLELNVDIDTYAGRFNIETKGNGWRNASATGSIKGNLAGADLSGINAAFLGGNLQGSVHANWQDELKITAALQGMELDPARFDPTWNGVVSFTMKSTATWSEGRLSQGKVHGLLQKSRLRGKSLSGEVDVTLQGESFRIARLFLAGKGFDIHADGVLAQRLNIAANISDLSGLIPQTKGSLSLKGWGRFASGIISGDISGQARNLAAEGIQITSASLSARLTDAPEHLGSVSADMSGVKYHGLRADNASLKADGLLARHKLALELRSAGSKFTANLSGGYTAGIWQGKLDDFSGYDSIGPCRLESPVPLVLSSQNVTIAPLVLTGLPSERIDISGRLQLLPLRGTAESSWKGIDLSRANQWLVDTRLKGLTSGILKLDLPADNRLRLTGKASATGTITIDKKTVNIQKASVDLDAGDRGTVAKLEFRTKEGVFATGRFNSSDPATRSVPTRGELQASWGGLDAAYFKRWVIQGAHLHGQLSGDISGKLLPEQHFDLKGNVALTDGSGIWRNGGQELKAVVRNAGLTWNWQGESLSGNLSLSLANIGEARGSFQLPLRASLDSAPDPNGKVRGTISGRFNEQGVLTSLFPGLLQETKGLLEVDLKAGGTWQTPTLQGTVALTQAGAYLPTAGIKLTDVRLAAHFDGNKIQITSYRINSGAGKIEGDVDIHFSGKKLSGYHGTLRGERFEAVHLPELQLMVSPDLTFDGTLDKVSAHGLILVPEMLVAGLSSSTVIKPSRDVAVVGRETAADKKTSKIPLDLQLRLRLGDKVVIKADGLDARLEGGVNLRATSLDAVNGTGEIKVAKGTYTIYGAKLDIKRGRTVFSGGAVERPALDILALREVDGNKVGVTITGTPNEPFIKLYSEPVLSDTEILSYLILGRKQVNSGDQIGMLMQAASMLVPTSKTTGVSDRLKQLSKFDTISLASDKETQSGYKPLEPSLNSGSQSKKDNSSVSHTMLQLGKYLTPKLYISYGRSLFDESQQLRARYTISKQWEVESKVSGTSTGGDLFYKIELD